MIDEKDFEDIMEDLDYEVYDVGSSDKNVDEAFYAYDEDGDYYVTFTLYDEVDDAKDEFSDMLEDVNDAKDDKDFDGSIKKSSSGNYQKVVVKGDFDEDSDMYDGDMYVVVIRVDNMVIMAGTDSTKDSRVKEVNKIISELGY
jgi:putative lipoic acid-binding regulatory protein